MHQRPDQVLFASCNVNGLKEEQWDLRLTSCERPRVAACAIQETKLRGVIVSWDQSTYLYSGRTLAVRGQARALLVVLPGPFACMMCAVQLWLTLGAQSLRPLCQVGGVHPGWPRGMYSHPPTGLSVCPLTPFNGEV